MMSAYDRWATQGPPEWDDEERALEHEAREQGEADYYGNSTLGFDADDYAPTHILECRFCPEPIEYYGDETPDADWRIVLGECDQAVCHCGAIYGEGDWLEVIDEDRVTAYFDGLLAARDILYGGCPDCGSGHSIQACPAIKTLLMQEDT